LLALPEKPLALKGTEPETADSILLDRGQHPILLDVHTRRVLETHQAATKSAKQVRALVISPLPEDQCIAGSACQGAPSWINRQP